MRVAMLEELLEFAGLDDHTSEYDDLTRSDLHGDHQHFYYGDKSKEGKDNESTSSYYGDKSKEGKDNESTHHQIHLEKDVYDEYSSDEETYLPGDFELPALNDDKNVAVLEPDSVADALCGSKTRRSRAAVPKRDYYTTKTVLLNKSDSRTRLDSIDKFNTNFKHSYDDRYNAICTNNSFPRGTPNIIDYKTKKNNLNIETNLQLRVMNAVIASKNIVSSKTKRQRVQQAKIDSIKEKSTLNHPGLDSLEEKMEDLRNEKMEHWATRHGKTVSSAFSTTDKRKLRAWFKQLDYDKSGEVNVDELQDVLLSSGILKTREQIKRVLTNADKNNTFGIDFEEFISALRNNTIAHGHKLKKVEELNKNEHSFEMETLISIERRKKLTNCIIKKLIKRQAEYEEAINKSLDESIGRKEREHFFKKLPSLEETARSKIDLYDQFVDSLEGVLELCRSRGDEMISSRLAARATGIYSPSQGHPPGMAAAAAAGRGMGFLKTSLQDIEDGYLDLSSADIDKLLRPLAEQDGGTGFNHKLLAVYK